MDNERLKCMLEQAAERLNELANRLNGYGKPLNHRERLMCRAALLPAVQASFDEALVSYLVGQSAEFITDDIASTLRDLEVL